MADTEWIEIGRVVGDTGPKGDTGDIGIGTVIKGHYNTYEEFIQVHPSGSLGDAYIVDGSYYYWDGTGWANAGSLKGDKGDTGDKGVKGDTGARLDQLDRKENLDLREILETQDLLEILDRPARLELLVLVLLLKVRMILTRN